MGDRPPIQFWFDFASGYSYFAALEIDALGDRFGRKILWRPFMLGTAFKKTGAAGLSRTPLKREYATHDWQRIARLEGVPFSPPKDHPQVALAATRLFYAVEEQNAALAPAFGRAVFEGYYQRQLSISEIEPLLPLVEAVGANSRLACERVADPGLKDEVKARGDAAVASGIFGAPWFVVDGQPFWGWDRLSMLATWLERDGW